MEPSDLRKIFINCGSICHIYAGILFSMAEFTENNLRMMIL